MKYWGANPYGLGGQPFIRAPGPEPCLFGYLKPFAALGELLAKLSKARINSIMYIDGLSEADESKYSSDCLSFADGPIDIRQAAANCDIALTNANHGTCVAMLLAGKPIVNVPPYLEQKLLSDAIASLGAGLTAFANDARAIAGAVNQVLGEKRFHAAARGFAARCRESPVEELAKNMLSEIEEMIA